MRRATILFVALAAVPVITAAASAQGATQRAQYLMGTVCEVAVAGAADGNAEIDAAFAEAARRGAYGVALESGHQRAVAHRLYQAAGMSDVGSFYVLRR